MNKIAIAALTYAVPFSRLKQQVKTSTKPYVRTNFHVYGPWWFREPPQICATRGE